MKNYYWNEESWGSNNGEPLPANIEDIIDEANVILDAYAQSNGYDEESEEIQSYSDFLWEYYCKEDALPKTYHKNWQSIANIMDDDIREQVHAELAPCSEEKFLSRYLELDPNFESVLDQFSTDIDY